MALEPVAPMRPRGLMIVRCVALERVDLDREIKERLRSLVAAFGRIVLEQLAVRALRGQAVLWFEAAGVRWNLDIPKAPYRFRTAGEGSLALSAVTATLVARR